MLKNLENYKNAMIAIHGRGASSSDIQKVAQNLCDQTYFIAAPDAPNHTWYPRSFMADESSNEPALSSSIDTVKNLIDDIARVIPKNRIVIMGFSQGACLALETAARYPARFGGVIAFTGGLIGSALKKEKYRGDFAGTRIFIGTSDQDPHVPLVRAQESKDLLEKMGADVTLKVYKGMGHTINDDEIAWVKKHISNSTMKE